MWTMNPSEFQKLSETVARIDERTLQIDKKLDGFATKEAVRAESARIDKLESDIIWMRRWTFGALAAAVIAFIRPKIGF